MGEASLESLKRRRSEQDMGEKRQRIDTGSSTAGEISNDFAAMLAQATNTVMQQHAPADATNNGLRLRVEQAPTPESMVAHQDRVDNRSNGFNSDPHLYMRILSLPILESLVRESLHALEIFP